MSRKFRIVNYEEILNLDIKVSEVLPPNHLARFVVDTIGQFDLSLICQRYSAEGREAIALLVLARICKITLFLFLENIHIVLLLYRFELMWLCWAV